MAINSFEEINSFVGKFASLWKQGYNVNLNLESKAGKAQVTLSLGLDDFPVEKTCLQKKVSPSRLRRRERRAFEWQNSAVQVKATEEEAENFNSEVVEAGQVNFKEETALVKGSSNITAKVVNEIAVQEIENSMFKEDTDKEDTEDFDKYIFSYWSNEGIADEGDASQFITKSLEQNFKNNCVPVAEQVVKVCGVRTIHENEDEVEVTLLLVKNSLPVEWSARNCQTGLDDNPLTVSLKRIIRCGSNPHHSLHSYT